MNSSSTPTSPLNKNREDADRVLANLARTTRSSLPEATPREPISRAVQAPAPVAAAVQLTVDSAAPDQVGHDIERAAEAPSSVRTVETPRAIAAPRKQKSGLPTVDKSFEINLGKGFKMLTVRIPNEKHAQIFLMAAQNKLSGNGEPKTLNDLIMRAIDKMLAEAA
jgi:hypothetical protein